MMRPQMDSDSEDELPGGWEQKTTADGNVYFVNKFEEKTQWTHPRTGRKKVVPRELPFGWSERVDSDGRTIYEDKEYGQKTYVDPRLAFIRDDKTHVNDFRQRFDSSSTAYQVLHGMDLSGKVAVVTGCNAGIGYETAKSLARHGCKVVLANRNMQATDSAISSIVTETSASAENLIPIHLDLTSLASVKKFPLSLKTKIDRIDMLILNAGIFGVPYGLTEDGIEQTTQVNHVSHTLLAILLRAMLVNGSRVIFVSSESHRRASMASFKEGLASGSLALSADRFSEMMAYNLSKLYNVVTAKILSEEWKDAGVTVNSLHPGNMVYTHLCNSRWLYWLAFQLVRPFTKSLQQAAATSVYAAVAPELSGVTGMYFNNCFCCEESVLARDKEIGRLVFSLTLALLVQRVGSEGLEAYLDKYNVAQ